MSFDAGGTDGPIGSGRVGKPSLVQPFRLRFPFFIPFLSVRPGGCGSFRQLGELSGRPARFVVVVVVVAAAAVDGERASSVTTGLTSGIVDLDSG